MNLTVMKLFKRASVVALITTCSFLTLQVNSAALTEAETQQKPTITKQQAKALTMLEQNKSDNFPVKYLRLQVEKLADSQGQVYLGAYVTRADLQPYLAQLKTILVDDFDDFRANQSARDHHSFHLTLINPIEIQHVDKDLLAQVLTAKEPIAFDVKLLGLGKVEKSEQSTYFVVAKSSEAQLLRQQFLLKAKDFHVTLGFKPNDIYGVKKDISTLIK